MAERRAAVAVALPAIVARGFSVLGRPGRVDMLADCIHPVVEAIIAELIGTATGLTSDALVSRVFSQALGVAQRLRMEAELAQLRSHLEARYGTDEAERNGSRMALAVLGRDALIGTLGCSLHAHFQALAGAPLSSKPLPRVPTHTGVPYIDRRARAAGQVAEMALHEGDVVRCRLQSLEDGTDADRLRFFGSGPHLCLGRAVSTDLFAELSAYLSGLTTRPCDIGFSLRRDDVFSVPKSFTVRIET
jgi:hypothetical protein